MHATEHIKEMIKQAHIDGKTTGDVVALVAELSALRQAMMQNRYYTWEIWRNPKDTAFEVAFAYIARNKLYRIRNPYTWSLAGLDHRARIKGSDIADPLQVVMTNLFHTLCPDRGPDCISPYITLD
jgi:hypothetical protein